VKTVRLPVGIAVHDQPGILFTFTPERFSRSSRNRVHHPPESAVFALRARAVDVQTAAEAQMVNRPDEDHLRAASASGRVLFTYNTADYCALHQTWVISKRVPAGIVVAPQQQYSVGEELRRIMRLVSLCTAEQMRNRLEFLSSWT
jgi:hypothetical protein